MKTELGALAVVMCYGFLSPLPLKWRRSRDRTKMQRGYFDSSLMKDKLEQYKTRTVNLTSLIWCTQTLRQEQSPTKHSKNMAA